jgi:hypothetical protein
MIYKIPGNHFLNLKDKPYAIFFFQKKRKKERERRRGRENNHLGL